jgi:hypothetical protein
MVAPAASVKSAGKVPLALAGGLTTAVVLEVAELKNRRPFPSASVVSVPKLVVPLVTV